MGTIWAAMVVYCLTVGDSNQCPVHENDVGPCLGEPLDWDCLTPAVEVHEPFAGGGHTPMRCPPSQAVLCIPKRGLLLD